MVSTLLRDPQTLIDNSTLASLGMLQPQAFRFLKTHIELGLGLYLSHDKPSPSYSSP
jgi:hypothetical protein